MEVRVRCAVRLAGERDEALGVGLNWELTEGVVRVIMVKDG